VAWRYNPPPTWPPPPPGWVPPPGWAPDPSWPPAPADWQFWVEEPAPTAWPAAAGASGPMPVAGPPPATPPPSPGPAAARSRTGCWLLLIVLAVLVVGLIAAVVVALLPLSRGTESRQLVTRTSGADVRVENPCGPIALRPGAAGVVTTDASVRAGWAAPQVSSQLDGGTVVVDVDCPVVSLGSHVELVVTVPPGGSVQARSSAGSVSAEGLDSALVLHSSAGSVTGRDLDSASVAADSSAGSVSLTWASRAPSRVEARSSAGSVTVLVPDVAGMAYRVSADSSAGSVDVAVRTDPQAPRSITATSSAGSVRVGYR